MLVKLTINSPTDRIIFTGGSDAISKSKKISINVGDDLEISLSDLLNASNQFNFEFNIDDLKTLCQLNQLKATIYPNGNLSFRKLDSSPDELKSCYFISCSSLENRYLICFALEEIQPMIYKAELINVLKYS